MNQALLQELVDDIVKYNLIGLGACAVLMLGLPSEPPAPELAGSVDYLPRVKHFYGQPGASASKQYLQLISDHCFSEWLKFRGYLTWYPQIGRIFPKDGDHIRTRLHIWNDIRRVLGYQVHENL